MKVLPEEKGMACLSSHKGNPRWQLSGSESAGNRAVERWITNLRTAGRSAVVLVGEHMETEAGVTRENPLRCEIAVVYCRGGSLDGDRRGL